jgi:ATP-binding cassette subfamily F protein 3
MKVAGPDATESEIRTLLGGFGITGEAADKRVGVLSGGERIRLAFARLLLRPPNLLLLDEPTTHLDVESREALQDALRAYEGSVLFVSHDVEFVRAVAQGILAIAPDGAGVRRYPGGYGYFLEKAPQDSAFWRAFCGDSAPPPTSAEASAEAAKADRRAALADRKAAKNELKKLEAAISAAETAIAELEEKLASRQLELARPDLAPAARKETAARLKDIQSALDEQNRLWEKAVQRQEELGGG